MARELDKIPEAPILPTDGWVRGGPKGPWYFYIPAAESKYITSKLTYIKMQVGGAERTLMLVARVVASVQTIPQALSREDERTYKGDTMWLDIFLKPGYEFVHIDKKDVTTVLREQYNLLVRAATRPPLKMDNDTYLWEQT